MVRTIEFDLFAPRNKGAVLLGSFSDWKEIPMEKDLTYGRARYYRALTKTVLNLNEIRYRFQEICVSPVLVRAR